MNMKLAPKTLTGILHASNKSACDWGWQGMLAYGCQTFVVIIETKSCQTLQTLGRHKAPVCKVKWARENYHHDLMNPYTLRVASGDTGGKIIVWDVIQASVKAEFCDGSKHIQDMEWISSQDVSHDLLATIHPPYTVILWNADTGTKLWKKNYAETLLSFSFDPFDANRVAFLGSDCVVFINDFSLSKCPTSNGKKFYISSPSSSGNNGGSSSNSSNSVHKSTSKGSLGKRMSRILVGEGNKRVEEENVALNECLQLTYLLSCRHHLLLVYSREMLILDLEINQTVGIIPMERTGSPFIQVIPCQQRDVLLALHESGSVSVRIRRRGNVIITPDLGTGSMTSLISQDEGGPPLDVVYDLRCQSDPLRVTKNNRVVSVAACPVSERTIALVMSDGKTLFWKLNTVDFHLPNQSVMGSQISGSGISPLYTPGYSLDVQFQFPPDGNSTLPLHCDKSHPKHSLCDLFGQMESFVLDGQTSAARHKQHSVMLKFVMTGMVTGVAAPALVIRMCPALTTKNWNVYQPMIALGAHNGVIQVYNLSSGELWREYGIHSCSVRGIEWVSLHSFLSYAYPTPGTSGQVKNELILTNMQTGKTVQYRQNRDEETPIEMVKISHLKQYFVVVFKDKPFELWDLRTGTLLREMPKNFPHITALEWSPSHNMKSLKKRLAQEGTQTNISQIDVSANPAETNVKPQSSTVSAREHFVFTDSDGLLYHFIVEGNMIKDGSKIPPDGGMGSITSIAWKGDMMVLGDVDGNLNLWDLKARVSRAIPTHRGWVRKVKFAPGRGNHKLLVLYNDGIDIWDAKELDQLSTIKSPKDIAKVLDAEWAGSDKPVIITADGCLRVLDIKLKVDCSPLDDYVLPEPLFSPNLQLPKVALTLKYLLQHQPWKKEYSLHLEGLLNEEWTAIQESVNEEFNLLDSELKEFLPICPFGTAQRALLVARLFGDESEVHFWTIALHFLRTEKSDPMSKMAASVAATTPVSQDISNNLLVFEDAEKSDTQKESSSSAWMFIKDKPLNTCYDVLCDSSSFQKYQLERVALHDSKRATYEHTCKCAENLILLGQTDRAVQLLLETEPENDGYYVDCLRACLVASVRSSGASQSTIKLVATNLIANDKLSEGVQLLCLIDKGFDACRYLQTYSQWDQAAWLAKAMLNYQECSEIMKRWVDHLCSPQVNQKSKAMLVLLSLGQFYKVLEMLYGMRYFDRAALFVEACFEFGLMEKTEKTTPLIEAVFLEYARFMINMGNQKGAEHYCHQAGENGKQLLKEVEILFAD
ncbi:WD repeat-containing protein 11-like isoform X2 [Tubulanus polymorphus]|uniref:WD repeat-containing protein 11-like isoform X2 n=1 Tax=Tubulanus polymorphus TaxID=672921 RepID=UPI003DA373EC